MEPGEELAIAVHLSSCNSPHTEARSLAAVANLLPAALEPVAPSVQLRDRVMSTVAATPQAHLAPTIRPDRPLARDALARPPWWRVTSLAGALAGAGLAAALVLGAWGLSLSGELTARDEALSLIATADAIHAASGDAGSGWLIERGAQALFVASDLEDLPVAHLYELWLIDADGHPMAAGTLTDISGVALVRLDQELGAAVTFAITIERRRVEAPTGAPVLVADLES